MRAQPIGEPQPVLAGILMSHSTSDAGLSTISSMASAALAACFVE
jgi:hypothetical protein